MKYYTKCAVNIIQMSIQKTKENNKCANKETTTTTTIPIKYQQYLVVNLIYSNIFMGDFIA